MNELVTQKAGATSTSAPLAEAVERVLIGGDLSQLRPDERLAYYKARCDAAGLDPRTQPFQYLSLQGKLTLYATKAATDQLIATRKLSVEIVSREYDDSLGLYVVVCRVRFPDGRTVEDVGALPLSNLRGDALANAVLKAITKAKRRTVLSACGLGMLDESEVETIPGGKSEPLTADYKSLYPSPDPPVKLDAPQNNSGFGRGQYASEDQAKEYLAKMEGFLKERNQRWIDRWTEDGGEIPDGVKDLCNTWQADGHLVKWGVATGRLAPESVDENGKIKNRQIGRYTGIIYHKGKEDRKALTNELVRYLDEQEANQLDALRRKHPELFAGDLDPDVDVVDTEFDEPANVQQEAPTGPPAASDAKATESTVDAYQKGGKGNQGSFLGSQGQGAYSS